jgi:sec-independent protein translocase protein TatA
MFGLSIGHLIILGIVILLFGARRLPELGSSLGKGMRAFKDAMEGKEVLEDLKPGLKLEQKDKQA